MKHKAIGIVVSMLVVFGLLLGGFGCAKEAPVTAPGATPAAPTYKWKASQDKKRGSPMSQNFVNWFCKPIEEASGGRIAIEPFSWGELVAGADILEGVKKGTLDISNSCTAYHPDMFASTVTFGVAGGMKTVDDWQIFYYDYGYRDFLQKNLYDSKGVYLLGPQVQPGQVEFLTKVITSFDDLKGLKFRSFGANGAIYGALGVSITDVAATEVYTATATGVVDGGTIGGLLSIVDISLEEVIKCVIIEPRSPSSLALPIVINLELWNSLPDDLKAIIEEVTIAYGNRYFQAVIYGAGEVKAILKDKGVITYEPTEADMTKWNKAVDGYWDDLAKKPHEVEALGMLKDFLVKMGYR